MDACVFFLRQRVISACPTFSWALETSWRRTQAWPSPQYNVSLVLAQYLCSVNWWPELSTLLYTDQLNFKKKKHTHYCLLMLMETAVLHIYLTNIFCYILQSEVITMPHYGKIPEPSPPSSKRAPCTFICRFQNWFSVLLAFLISQGAVR